MSFMRRLRTGISYILNGKATAAALRPSWVSGQPQYASDARFEVLVREGYRKNELIYACIEAWSDTASQISLQVKEKETEEILSQHPLLDLIHHPNDKMNESDFWASIAIFQKLAGRAVYEIEFNNKGLPIALWALNPDRLRVILDDKRPVIKEYIYRVPGMEDQHLEPFRILDFPLFDPLGEFKAYPPVAVASRVGDVDNAATDHIKLTWEHGGMPQGLLKTTQVLTEQSITDTRRRWRERYGGRENWTEPAILDRDQEFQKIAWSFQELGFEMLDARDEARICAVLKVPPIIVGAKIGLDRSTYSNYLEARRSWWEDRVLAFYANCMDVIEFRLLPFFDRDLRYSPTWDISGVWALQENVDNRWKRATEALRAGAITKNEFYQQVGLEGIGKAGDVYIYNLSMVDIPKGVSAAPLPDLGENGTGSQEELEEIEEEMSSGGKNGSSPEGSAHKAEDPPDARDRRKLERKIAAGVTLYLEEQLESVMRDAANIYAKNAE